MALLSASTVQPRRGELSAAFLSGRTGSEPKVTLTSMKATSVASLPRSKALLGSVLSRRPFTWLSWKFSLILPLALVALLATVIVRGATGPETLRLTVQDELSGQAVPGAQVQIGNQTWTANDVGVIELPAPEASTDFTISAAEYASVTGSISERTGHRQTMQLRQTTVRGTVTDSASGQPVADASVSMLDDSGQALNTTKTGTDGNFTLTDGLAGARIQVDAGDRGTAEGRVDENMTVTLAVEQTRAAGRVLSADGEPLQGALVLSGDEETITKGDGTYRLENVSEGSEVQVTAAGFGTVVTKVSGGKVADVSLERQMIKGVYANFGLLGEPGGLDQLIEIANTTEVNAIVIDIKQDTVYYKSEVPFFNDAGTVRDYINVNEIITKLDENNIYAIARLVVFQDPLVAEARPDLAVMNEDTGDLWRNEMGIAWVNAFEEELWDANIALATEAVGLGFDEIQYDYVRFPSDGDLNPADFGQEYTAEAREGAITEFMKRSSEAIHEAGGLLSADLFGYVTLDDDEQWIGQKFSKLEPYLDFVSMMIYPSHFSEGNIASAPGHPNDYPYETIYESLERAEANVPGSKVKFRPWLQDFSYGYNGLRDYGPEDVRAQIDAAEDFGASGWLLWGNPFDVTVEALEPDPAARREQAA